PLSTAVPYTTLFRAGWRGGRGPARAGGGNQKGRAPARPPWVRSFTGPRTGVRSGGVAVYDRGCSVARAEHPKPRDRTDCSLDIGSPPFVLLTLRLNMVAFAVRGNGQFREQ